MFIYLFIRYLPYIACLVLYYSKIPQRKWAVYKYHICNIILLLLLRWPYHLQVLHNSSFCFSWQWEWLGLSPLTVQQLTARGQEVSPEYTGTLWNGV